MVHEPMKAARAEFNFFIRLHGRTSPYYFSFFTVQFSLR